jgi:ligand-binding SRPBCC domain-containing protein
MGPLRTMETIRLATWIDAPVERCFLLSLSIDLHCASAYRTGEKAIAGVTTGLIGEGETVTFRGRHFGLRWRHTSRIETLRPYSHFRDVMIAGPFRRFEHDHHFATMDDGTRIRDEIRFSAPWGPLGRLATRMFVRKHLKAFLMERNAVIKRVAESEEWHKYVADGVEGQIAASVDGKTTVRWDGSILLRSAQGIAVPRPPNS